MAKISSVIISKQKMNKSLDKLQALVADDSAKVNEVILKNLDSGVPLVPLLARHIIASGGKRLRPALTLLSAKLCGYNGDRHINLAACVEFIHTATLLHDDVVDESALRRGKATANDIWGNKASVLVGDFLFSKSFQLMVADGSLQTLKILSDASAIIAQGEVMQLETSNDISTTREQYIEVVTAKTATLFAAACEIGAVVAEKTESQENLRKAGLDLGVAFQIMDDALDYSAQQEELGKAVGDDFRDGKITLPIIFAYEKSNEAEQGFWKRTLEKQEFAEGDLEKAISIISKYDAISESITIAKQYCESARASLASFPNSPEKAAFLEIIDFCADRGY